MALFQKLQLWMDPVKRPGPGAMAVDEWLLETAEVPVLRVYGWSGEWGSIGYFGKLAAANVSFSGLQWVRRWTGGGTVDHRVDWTYSLIVPAGEVIADSRGAESYRAIHAALARALQAEGIDARLSSGAGETGADACFENPVNHDLIDAAGRKLAGAGQRRTKKGLLHQGSVALGCDEETSKHRAATLAMAMATHWELVAMEAPNEVIERKICDRYGRREWMERRVR